MVKWLMVSWLLLAGVAVAQPGKVVSNRLFEMTVPAAWEEQETRSADYFLYPSREPIDMTRENVSLTPSSLSAGFGLDDYAFMAKYQVERDFPELKLASSNEVKFGPIAGHRFDFRGTRGGKKFVVIQVMGIQGSRGYTLQFTGSEANYNSVKSAFEKMMSSFKPK